MNRAKPRVILPKLSPKAISLALLAVSLMVRIGLWVPVVELDVPLYGDERMYYARARAFDRILENLLQARLPPSQALNRGYYGGRWPPLHPILLSLGLYVFGENVAAARLVVVLLSATTTLVVYALTRRLSTEHAAAFAALIHALYPSFIAFSHYLWSETSYILLLLLTVYCAVSVLDAQARRRRALWAILCGFCLGLCALTRAAALPLLFLVPLWLALTIEATKLKVLLPTVAVLVCLFVLLPWEIVLARAEGRFILLTVAGDEAVRTKLISASEDPRAFAVKVWTRLRDLWGADENLLRHVLRAFYPPLQDSFVGLVWIASLASYLLLIALSIWGLWGAIPPLRNRCLILALIIAVVVPPTLTTAITRYNLPSLALLLPAAGHGAANLKLRKARKRRMSLPLLFLLLFLLNFVTSPRHLGPLRANDPKSSHYSELLRRVDRILGTEQSFGDTVAFRAKDPKTRDVIDIVILSEDYGFGATRARQHHWELSPKKPMLAIKVYSSSALAPLQLELHSERSGQSAVFQPVDSLAWRRWQPTGVEGIDWSYTGLGSTETE